MSDKGTVLVVDDEEVMREILDSLLIKEGYRVKLAATGEGGLELMPVASRSTWPLLTSCSPTCRASRFSKRSRRRTLKWW